MKSNYKKLGEYIRQVDVRNTEGNEENLLGVSVQKTFIPSIANTVGTDFTKYKIVKKGQFTYIPDTSRRGDKIGIALLTNIDEGLVSNVYTVFEIVDKTKLLPEYLMLWFSRAEFDRYARFKSHGSVREIMDWNEMCNVELPIPSLEVQREIVREYQILEERIQLLQRINDNLDDQMKALFKSWFIDFEPFNNSLVLTEGGNYIPENWIETTLGEYVTYTQGTQVPVEEQYSELDKNRVRFLRIVDYTGNTSDEPRYIEVKSKNSTCCPEDILIIRYGASAGQICRGLSGVFANNLFSITPTKLISNSYLYYLLTQPTVQNFITSVGETSSAMPALTHGLISSIPIVIPQSAKYLNDFAQIADKVFKQQLLINKEIDVLMSLSKNLLANLSSR